MMLKEGRRLDMLLWHNVYVWLWNFNSCQMYDITLFELKTNVVLSFIKLFYIYEAIWKLYESYIK